VKKKKVKKNNREGAELIRKDTKKTPQGTKVES
jgi:hypothetical protein